MSPAGIVNGKGTIAFPASPTSTEINAMAKATARKPRGMASGH